MNYLPRKLQPLMGKVLSSVADQATSSGTNFVMNVLLARWLTRTDYGAFSVFWSFCLIFAALHNALILEPMTIVGPAEYGSSILNYLKKVGRLNWRLVLALGLLAAAAGLFYREPTVRYASVALAVCLPGYLLLLTSRREQYVLNRPERAFQISLIYACSVGGLLALFRAASWLSVYTGMACLGVGLPIAIWARGRWRSSVTPASARTVEHSVNSIARAHWIYGRWLLASAILTMGIPDLQIILLSLLVDLKSAGALRAMMNFILPLFQLLTVLSVYALPALARRMKGFGTGRGLRQSVAFPLILAMLSLVYLGAVVIFGAALEHILYNGRMSQYVAYLPLLSLSALLSAVGVGFSTLLRAAQNSKHQLVAGLAGTAIGIGAALLLLRTHGLGGAIASMILANVASSACIIGTYIWLVRKHPADWSSALHFLQSESRETAEAPSL